MWPTPVLIALVFCAITVPLAWGATLIWLPFAIRRGQSRYWLREAGFLLYLTVFAVVLFAAYGYLR